MIEWKKINDDYLISSSGKVYSLKTKKVLSLNKVGKHRSYYKIDLYSNSERKPKLVHRLVAETFIPNPNNLPEVNHKDGNGLNDNVENLEWCDRKYNNEYSNLQEELTNKKKKKVYQYTLDGELVKIWDSTRECSRNGFSQSSVSSCCLGKQIKPYKGYKWSFNPL